LIYLLLKNSILSNFSSNSKLVLNYFIFIIPLTMFVMYTTIFEAYASMLYRIVIPKIIREVFIRILTIIIIALLFFHLISLNDFVICFVGIYGIAMLINLFYIFKLEAPGLKPNFNFIEKKLLKEMVLFMLFTLFVGIGSNVASKIDVYMVTTKINLENTGIFTIAFFIAAFIEMPSRAIFQITTPFVSEALKNNSMEMVSDLYKRVALNQLIIGGFFFLLIWVNVNNIFGIMPNGPIYERGKYVIFFIGLAKVFDAATGLNAVILGYSKYYFYILFFIFFLAGLAILNNLIFIPLYGINGSALATAITVFSYNILLVLFVRIKLKTQPFGLKTILAFAILLAFFFINYLFKPIHNLYFDALIRSAVISVLFIFTILKLKVSSDFNNTFNSISQKYLRNKIRF
jgi:O-antigen/teichoic acid export membrane protein